MKGTLELIKKLSLAFGPSGMEDEVREIILEEIKDYADATTLDALGNIIVRIDCQKPNAPTLMLSAHMDEIGMMITHVEDCGVLRFAEIGGMNTSILSGKRVTVYGHDEKKIRGVIASKAIHLQTKEEREHHTKLSDLYIDVGASSKEQALSLVQIGDCATFDSDFTVFGDDSNRIKCKALDDRAGCAILIELLRDIKKNAPSLNCNLAICFTTREETGLSGASVASYSCAPDYAIILETTTVADLPSVEETRRVASLGGGTVISLLDRGSIYDRDFIRYAMSFDRDVKLQVKEYVSGGNDTRHIQLSRDGTHALVLSVPTRYLHSASCVLDVRDVYATKALAYKLVCNFNLDAVSAGKDI